MGGGSRGARLLTHCGGKVERDIEMSEGEVKALPRPISIDWSQSAVIIVDMCNDFVSEGGWVTSSGRSVERARSLFPAINATVDAARDAGSHVIWVNWGLRSDLREVPRRIQEGFHNGSIGMGTVLANGSAVLQSGSWGSQLPEELHYQSGDAVVEKNRLSGFFNTSLDSILRNMGVGTLLFAGVNLDQCVYFTLHDAWNHGYRCVILEDCCATSSPPAAAEGALFNIKLVLGWVASSESVIAAMG